jgi:polyphosphate kinase
MTKAPSSEATPTIFLDRDLSWLEFNRRVLHEALDARTPLLERVKFLAIFHSNLDEFFMKRVGLLKRRLAVSPDGQMVESEDSRRLTRIRQTVLSLLEIQANTFTGTVRPELAQCGIHLLDWSELNEFQSRSAEEFFRRNVFPVLTPLAVDPSHPFPFISNLSTSLGLMLRSPEGGEAFFARVKVPDTFPQWLPLPDDRANSQPGPRRCFVRLLDVIHHNLARLFPGMTVLEVMPFRVTRNAAIEAEEDPAESLADRVEEELSQRRFEKVIRLEYGPEGSPTQLQMLRRKLDLKAPVGDRGGHRHVGSLG